MAFLLAGKTGWKAKVLTTDTTGFGSQVGGRSEQSFSMNISRMSKYIVSVWHSADV